MNYSQEQLLQQKLVMTQEMMQSLEILQVSAVELKGIIDREQEENPLIEVVEEHSEQVKSDVVEQKKNLMVMMKLNIMKVIMGTETPKITKEICSAI